MQKEGFSGCREFVIVALDKDTVLRYIQIYASSFC